MRSSIFFERVPAPHRTKRFWIFFVVGIVPILCTPLYMLLMGFRPFPLRVQIHSGLVTFTTWVAFFWFGFRFGRTAWLIIGMLIFTFAFFAWLHS
jgi:hypothetical protein